MEVKKLGFINRGSPQLLTTHSATVQSYNDAEKGDLRPVPEVVDIKASLWSCNYDLGAWQLACIFDCHSILRSRNCHFKY